MTVKWSEFEREIFEEVERVSESKADRGARESKTNGAKSEQAKEAPIGLGEWDAGDDVDTIPPRAWLLGNIFARGFMSSLLADGGTGKTALRYAQLLSLAIGRSLTGDHVFQRCRVLIISLEDDTNELRRRILALLLHYKIDRSELKGWLFLAAPGAAAGKLMSTDKTGRPIRGALADNWKPSSPRARSTS
jgi:RecA-family ATPase